MFAVLKIYFCDFSLKISLFFFLNLVKEHNKIRKFLIESEDNFRDMFI